MTALLYIGQLAAFCGCVALGLTVKSATVECSMQLVTVPLPASGLACEDAASQRASSARTPVAQHLAVPCDAEEREADS